MADYRRCSKVEVVEVPSRQKIRLRNLYLPPIQYTPTRNYTQFTISTMSGPAFDPKNMIVRSRTQLSSAYS